MSNVRVKFIRPQYNDLREWCQDPNNVYIGRRGIVFVEGKRYPPEDSPFANPFKVTDGSREAIIALYENYLLTCIQKEEITREQLLTLKGKNLGCWCTPLPCHGDILKRIVDSL